MPPDVRPGNCAVLYSTDAAFLAATCISARSIREHAAGTPPTVTILLHDVPPARANCARQFLERAGVDVRMVTVDPSWCQPWAGQRGQSPAKFGLLRLSEWFGDEIARVVVVDSDTRFVGDVGELLQVDLSGHVVGAVADIAMIADGRLHGLTARLGLPVEAGYFNSGLLVVDMAQWKTLGIETAARRVFTERPGILTFNDQCALNAVIAGNWLRLPFRWNHLNGSADREWPVSMIHYAGHFKPWSLGLAGKVRSIAGFVGRDNIAYYEKAAVELEEACLGPISNNLLDTIRILSIYLKWRLNGRFSTVLGRSTSADLLAYLDQHPQMTN